MAETDTDSKNDKSLVIFGRDVAKLPCFRNSYLYGVGGGIASGLTYFMFTSRTQHSCHFAVATFAVITLSYWTQCRYKYSQTKFEMLRMQELLKQHSMYEGSAQEAEVDRNIVPVDLKKV